MASVPPHSYPPPTTMGGLQQHTPAPPAADTPNPNTIPAAPQQQAAPAAVPQPQTVSDFHKLFPQVPLNENVVQDFQCSLSRKKLLRMGRLYLTPVRLCFSSMLVDPIELPWADVENCEKKSQMLFDQILVTPTDRGLYGSELCFTGFMNGCANPYGTMRMLWNARRKYDSRNSNAPSLSGTARGLRDMLSDSSSSSAQQQHPAGAAAAASSASSAVAEPQNPSSAPSAPVPTSPVNNNSSSSSTRAANQSTPVTAALFSSTAGRDRPGHQSPSKPPVHGGSQSAAPPVVAGGGPVYYSNNASLHEDSSAAGGGGGGGAGATSLPTTPQEGSLALSSATTHNATPPTGGADDEPSLLGGPTTTRSPAVGDRPTATSPPPPPLGTQPTTEGFFSTPDAPSTTSTAPPPVAVAAAASVESTTNATTTLSPRKEQQQRQQQHRRTRSDGGDAAAERLAQAQSVSNDEVIRTFPNVPTTESILESYQCSYVAGVHRLGKLHVTSNFLLFHSVMMNEPIVIKIIDVAALERVTNLLVLDGLSIQLHDGTKHDFTSLMSRAKAQAMIQQLMDTHATVAKSVGAPVAAGARPPSSASTMKAPEPSRGAAAAPAAESPAASPIASPGPPPTSSTPDNNDTDASGGGGGGGGSPTNPIKITLATALAGPSVGPYPVLQDLNDFAELCPVDVAGAFSKPALFLDTILNESTFPAGYDLDDVFAAFHDDNAPVMRSYRSFRRDEGVTFEPWRAPKKGGTKRAATTLAGQRTMNCQTIIRVISERLYPYEEYHRFAFGTLGGGRVLLYQTSGQATGVTFSDTFRTESLGVYTETKDPQSGLPIVKSTYYMYVNFIKFSIVKSKVRSESLKELKDGMGRLAQMMIDHLRDTSSRFGVKRVGGGGGGGAAAPRSISAAEGSSSAGLSSSSATSAATVVTPAAAAAASTPLAAVSGPLVAGPVGAANSPAAGAVAGWGGISVPAGGIPRYVALVCLGFASWYCLVALWNGCWTSGVSVPIIAVDAEGGTSPATATTSNVVGVQQVALVAHAGASLLVDVVRPVVMAATFVFLSQLLGVLLPALL